MMKWLTLVLATCAVLAGCVRDSNTPPFPQAHTAVVKSISVDAQAEVDRLNAQCAIEPWRSEIEMIELPETRPANRVVSGEVRAFVSDCKKRIAQYGVRVKWNPTKKVYEIEVTQPGISR